MKNCFLIAMLFTAVTLQAQLNKATVEYEKKEVMWVPPQFLKQLDKAANKPSVQYWELTFNDSISSFIQLPVVSDEANNLSSGNIRVFSQNNYGSVYLNLMSGEKIQEVEADKKYLVKDSIEKIKWKFTNETKTILNYTAQKAVGTKYETKNIIHMENGEIRKKQVLDTTEVIAWFTNEIPVASGPELQGQLPGLILELSLDGDRVHFTATKINPKINVSKLKAPKGNFISPAEWKAMSIERAKQMQKNFMENSVIRQ